MTKNNAFRRTDFRSEFRSNARAARRRRGFTMLEILTSVTLGLMLMYAVARIFSQVGGAMNETMSTMEAANALRNAKQRLTTDLEALSVTPAPPRNSRRDEGFFCYVEGMGGPYNRVADNANAPFSTGDVALDRERLEYYGGDPDYYVDGSVGDVDDILSFTAKAPTGAPFKGRYIQPIYKNVVVDGVPSLLVDDGVEATFESEYAEIIWFVRGTTLYRRVLPLMPDSLLQESFAALVAAVGKGSVACPDVRVNAGTNWVRQGCGFYRFYDVSVHKDADGNLVANTLGDLSNRANRYFYWNSPAQNACFAPPVSASPHGGNGAWYWLRTATLQESARPDFVAGNMFGGSFFRQSGKMPDGTPFVNWIDMNVSNAASNPLYDLTRWKWTGGNQALSLNPDDASAAPGGGVPTNAAELPIVGKPFIDFWNVPNPWNEVDFETGDLRDSNLLSDGRDLIFNQDVVLTNVISFNVRAWDPELNAYVDLGAAGPAFAEPAKSLRSFGRYWNPTSPLYMPCVYDTWTEQYEREFILNYETGGTNVAQGTTASIPLDGEISSADLLDFPPPYDVPLKSVQIEIRVFDPRSKNLRNATFNVDFTKI